MPREGPVHHPKVALQSALYGVLLLRILLLRVLLLSLLLLRSVRRTDYKLLVTGC